MRLGRRPRAKMGDFRRCMHELRRERERGREGGGERMSATFAWRYPEGFERVRADGSSNSWKLQSGRSQNVVPRRTVESINYRAGLSRKGTCKHEKKRKSPPGQAHHVTESPCAHRKTTAGISSPWAPLLRAGPSDVIYFLGAMSFLLGAVSFIPVLQICKSILTQTRSPRRV